nr:MAG TPA: hypothetical protein [Caudoviricetes sp.]
MDRSSGPSFISTKNSSSGTYACLYTRCTSPTAVTASRQKSLSSRFSVNALCGMSPYCRQYPVFSERDTGLSNGSVLSAISYPRAYPVCDVHIRVFQYRGRVFSKLREQLLVHVAVKTSPVTWQPVCAAIKVAVNEFQCADSADLRVLRGLLELLEYTFRLLRDACNHEGIANHHRITGGDDECGTAVLECYKRYTATDDIRHYFTLMK